MEIVDKLGRPNQRFPLRDGLSTYSDEDPTRLRDDPRAETTRLELEDPKATLPPDPIELPAQRPGASMRMEPGARVDRYQLDRLLGQGTFGRVFAARDTKLGRMVAIKVLHAEQASIPEIRQRFLQEANAAARIAHPGIVTVHDIGELAEVGTAYIVMELMTGESLQARVARGPLVSSQAKEIGRQVASALDAAHRAGVIHRDLKPENIFLVPDPAVAGRERTKVLDFGLAKATQSASVKTRAATVFGTPVYMSPEQCESTGDIDHRADIYSLGCILYELVVGKPPFLGSIRELVTKHRSERPADLTTIVPHVDLELAALVGRMLAKQPAARPGSMAEVEQVLTERRPEALGSGHDLFASDSVRTAAVRPHPLRSLADTMLSPFRKKRS